MTNNLNIKNLLKLFDSTNTSYKFLFFYALIKIIKNNNFKKKILFKEIIKEMFVIAWLPTFQFNLNFRKMDKIKDILIDFTKEAPEFTKINKPTNKIINHIHKIINNIINEDKKMKFIEQKLLKDVKFRLVRPFYQRLKRLPESGELGMFKLASKVLRKDYQKEQPPYLIDEDNRELILNRKWSNYFREHFIFLELWVLHEWYKYMQYQNRNTPSLYNKLKFPEFQRTSLDKQRKFWKKIIKKNTIRCIYSNQILNENNFDIDHFICWNFLAHDEEWNLIPILSEINRSKNNKIPEPRFIEPFVNLKIKSFDYAKETLTKKLYEQYLMDHSNFINFSYNDCFTLNYKKKYNDEIQQLSNKAKNQGYEIFNFNY